MPSQENKRRAAQPPVSVQVAFYNVELTVSQLFGQDREIHRKQLGMDCAGSFESHDLAVLCLCGFGPNKLNENQDAHLGNSANFRDKYGEENVNTWLQQLIRECCETPMDLQACVLGPYVVVLDTSICCFHSLPRLTDPLFTQPDTDHTHRRAVHSVIQVRSHHALIDVWVHHASWSSGRKYTAFARQRTMEYFFENVSGRAIVGGDLHMSKFGIQSALSNWSSRTRHTQEGIDECFKAWQIHTLFEAKHGDLALTRGLTASQIAVTHVGCESHELVVVQINLDDVNPSRAPG